MKTVFKFIGAAALVAGMSMPALADGMMDASKMTCKDMMAMDSAGMMEAGKALNTMAKSMGAMSKPMTDEEMTMAAEAACKAHPDMMVTDAMKSNM